MPDVFHSARLKVKTANSHIDALIENSTPLSQKLYEITNGPAYSRAIVLKPDCFQLTYRPKEPISDFFSPKIGDAVNNLRESLDLWLTTALRSIGKAERLHFPFTAKWEELEASGNYVSVKKVFPDLAAFVLKEIKPCRNANLELWAATSLCNDNKHDDFIPIVNVVSIDNINARFDGVTMRSCASGGDANHPVIIVQSVGPITIEQNFSVTVDITFRKGAIFENQPVIPTLTNMSQVVSQTLDALTEFMAPYLP